MKKKTISKESWKQLYHTSRTLENWILPHNGKDFRTKGILVKIMQDYFDSQLKGTAVNIKNEINNFIYFHGEVPESFLGKVVGVEQTVIGEDKDSYMVEQIISPHLPSKKEFDCYRMVCAIGKFPKK